MLNCPLVSGGLARVNAWGDGDRVWVGLWLVQTRWAESQAKHEWKNQLLGGIGLRCEGQGLKEMYEADFLHRE